MSDVWQVGDRVRHRFNAELGPGMIVAAEGRRLSVLFPLTGERLEIAAGSDALARLELEVGGRARIGESGVEVTIEQVEDDRRASKQAASTLGRTDGSQRSSDRERKELR